MTYTAHLFLGNGFKMEIKGTNKRKLEAEARRSLKEYGHPPYVDGWKKYTSWGDPVCHYIIEDENEENVTAEYSTGLFKSRNGAFVWSAY